MIRSAPGGIAVALAVLAVAWAGVAPGRLMAVSDRVAAKTVVGGAAVAPFAPVAVPEASPAPPDHRRPLPDFRRMGRELRLPARPRSGDSGEARPTRVFGRGAGRGPE